MDDLLDERKLISEFNEAAYQIARLNSLWSLCNTYARTGKLVEYKWVLDRIWLELSADAKQTNKEFYYKGIDMINKAIAKARGKENFYNALQQKEMFLRYLQEDVGKGGKKQKTYSRIM